MKQYNKVYDFLNNEMNVGDTIIFADNSNRGNRLNKTIIKSFSATKKSAHVEYFNKTVPISDIVVLHSVVNGELHFIK